MRCRRKLAVATMALLPVAGTPSEPVSLNGPGFEEE
jgi:hypothetical protein